MPRANLNKERIFAAAADLANQNGFAALSLKDIAAHFGVKPPSLFKHVRDLAEVRDALAVSGMLKLKNAISAAAGKTPADRLGQIMHAYRHFAKKFPGEYDAFQETHVLRSPEVYKIGEEVLGIFASALPENLSASEKIHTLRFLRSAVHGFVAIEKTGGFGLAEKIDESFQRMVVQMVGLFFSAK